MNLFEALSQTKKTTFTREEVKSIAKENNIKTPELKSFLQNPSHKASRGTYVIQQIITTEPKESDEEIEKRITDRFDVLEKLTESAASGETRALIVSGPPGLGKTHTVTQIVNTVASDQVIKILSGSASAIGLFKALHATQSKGSVLVIDDCDTVFFDLAALSLIKAACDSTKKRIIRWCSDYHFQGDDLQKEFEYNGTLIFITNIDFDTELAKKNKLTPHLDALMSRAHYLTLGIKSRREYLIRITQVIKQMYVAQEFGKEEAIDAITFVRDNADKLRELSCRTAIKLVQLRKSLPDDWKRVARITMCKV